MRVFVAAELPPGARAAVDALARPGIEGLRWSRPEQWHVTMAFLGEVEPATVASVGVALRGSGAPPGRARLGPATALLGRSILCVPVTGLDVVATRVAHALRAEGFEIEERPFRGHVTLARARGRRSVPPSLRGAAIEATWEVDRLAVMESRPGEGGSRYEVLEHVPLPGEL
jgi:RNA 2',3'-cyclic 3'-phosphodiesterase